MSPMAMIESHHAIGVPILTNQDEEDFAEEIVQMFAAHATPCVILNVYPIPARDPLFVDGKVETIRRSIKCT